MTQTAAVRITSRGDSVDYTPTSNVAAGDVVLIGAHPMVATAAIVANCLGSLACEGVFDLPKTSDVFTVGDAVYWDTDGTDVGSNTGAADNSYATGYRIGTCVTNAAANATHVRTKLASTMGTATIAGSMTADDITGSDTSLGITGKTGTTTGGVVAITGGVGAADNAGGAVTITGGASGTGNGAGGAVTITAGAGDGTGDGGAASLIGGASGDGASANGGAVTITAGAATNATSGDGGAITITGGAGPTVGNTGGAVTILSGAGDASNGTAGAIILDSSGTGATKGAITIATNAASLTFGKMPRLPFTTVAANGGNLATAGVLVEGINLVTGADNSKGVILPSCVNGKTCIVISQTTDKTLKIYPPVSKQINGAGANNAITLAANGTALLMSEGANAYYGGLFAGIMS